jgi:protein-L-isoaspartate(D-aspartate) O-methyltransferase
MHTIALGLGALLVAALGSGGACEAASGSAAATAPATAQEKNAAKRAKMVETQLVRRGITDEGVLQAMRRVPRHEFVPDVMKPSAYADRPLPIGHDVTISQPYIVALMTQLARVEKGDRVLDVGTGSGYQAAVLGEMGAEVYGIEIIEPLAERAAAVLKRLGYTSVSVRHGDGWQGWPEHAPFDAVILAAAPLEVPKPLKDQLKVGGRLVLPVGKAFDQKLLVITRTRTGFDEQFVLPVSFVPMTGEAQK